MRRIIALVAGCGLAVALGIGLGATAALAEAPSQQGWWSSANPGSLEGSPTPPPPPDVPSKGLLVQGGAASTSSASNSGAVAYAAISYLVPSGVTVGTLTLTVAPTSATTPAATLELCQLINPGFYGEQGGPMIDAPSYSCKNNVTAQPSSSGATYEFKVSTLVASGSLAVAILPTSPVSRVVFSQPDANSLSFQVAAPPTGNTGTAQQTSPTTPVTAPPSINPTPTTAFVPITGNTGFALPSGSNFSPPAATTPTQAPAPQASAPTAAGNLFTPNTPTIPGVNSVTVTLILLAMLLGGIIWMAVGRAAERAALEGDPG